MAEFLVNENHLAQYVPDSVLYIFIFRHGHSVTFKGGKGEVFTSAVLSNLLSLCL